MYQIMCHCVSQDCSNCPMKNTGTAGVLAEWNFFHRSVDKIDQPVDITSNNDFIDDKKEYRR